MPFIKAKRTYNCSLISSSSTSQLWKNINILLHRFSVPALPSYGSLSLLFQSFVNSSLTRFTSSILVYLSIVLLPLLPFLLHLLHITSHPSLRRFLSSSLSPDTKCDIDSIPTSLLKQCSHILLTTIINILNLSFFVINSNHCLYILTSVNLTWINIFR